jgi:hypothetical protein
MKPSDIILLEEAIRATHNCEPQYERTEVVPAIAGEQFPHGGFVRVYRLLDHPKARRCYAWTYRQQGDERKSVTVLELPPVDSAESAIKAAIASNGERV